jgi:hypothetical protein
VDRSERIQELKALVDAFRLVAGVCWAIDPAPNREIVERAEATLQTFRERLFLPALTAHRELLERHRGSWQRRTCPPTWAWTTIASRAGSLAGRVLDSLELSPAYVNFIWGIITWNRAASVALVDYGALVAEQRNLDVLGVFLPVVAIVRTCSICSSSGASTGHRAAIRDGGVAARKTLSRAIAGVSRGSTGKLRAILPARPPSRVRPCAKPWPAS